MARFGERRWGKAQRLDVFANFQMGTASGATANTAARACLARNIDVAAAASGYLTPYTTNQQAIIDAVAGYSYIDGGTAWQGSTNGTAQAGNAYRVAAHMSITGPFT